MNTSANSATVSSGLPFIALAIKRLIWKETRQVAPLVIMLLVISLFLHLLPISSNRLERAEIHRVFLLLFPCLYAIGAGALLVSQEKEQRTISWLGSLPIASSQILQAKLVVGLIGLIVVWSLSLLLALVFGVGSIVSMKFGEVPFPLSLTITNSVFLLCLSFATAWRLQSPLVALVAIVPLATLPTVVFASWQYLWPGFRLPDFIVGGLYLVLSGLFLAYGWHSGMAYLNWKPQSALWQRASRTLERRGSRGSLLSAKPQGLASTLIWQFGVQNRMLPIALVAIVVIPLVLLVFQWQVKEPSFIAMIAWLIVSWLGASVFQSDSVHQRIKFLAERGVAPPTIWWTRQILPLGIVVVAMLVAALLLKNFVFYSPTKPPSHPWMMFGIPAVLIAHAAAQWLGQLIRSPIVSLIVAPAVTFSAIGYLAFAVAALGMPYWMVSIPILIAFTATRLMTQRWMDARIGLKYWLGHGAFLFAATVIPILPVLHTAFAYPGMPRSVEQRFQAEAARNAISMDLIELVLITNPNSNRIVGGADPEWEMENSSSYGMMGMGTADSSEMRGAENSAEEPTDSQPVLGFVQQIKQNIDSIGKQLEQRAGPVKWSQAIGFLSAEAILTRAQLDVDPTNEESKERYRTAMRLLNEVVKRLRMSWQLVDQEFADRLEMWMYEQVSAKDGREAMGESNWDAITSTLSNKAGRTAARQRAIIHSLDRSWVSEQLVLGGIALKETSGLTGLRKRIADFRRVSRAAWLLFEYADSKDQMEADKRFAEVAAVWGKPGTREPRPGLSREAGPQIPGQNWFGDWEEN